MQMVLAGFRAERNKGDESLRGKCGCGRIERVTNQLASFDGVSLVVGYVVEYMMKYVAPRQSNRNLPSDNDDMETRE